MNTLPRHWLLIACVLYVFAAWFSMGHYHDDEYAQVLNFATAKTSLDMQSELMWEFKAGVRSGLQPFTAYVIAAMSKTIGIDSPHILSFIYRLFSASISLFATIIFINAIRKDITSEKVFKWTVFFLLFSWLLLFINVRFSSEGWAASFFLLGLALYLLIPKPNVKHLLSVGFILGLAFLSRYQTGFMLLGLGLWMILIDKIKPLHLIYILVGGLIALILGACFDTWLYDSFTISSWNYFLWHLKGFMSGSGIDVVVYEPWYFYIHYGALQTLPPITLLLPISVILFWILFPRHPITWLSIPFVVFHTYFGHKEMRYMFPVLPYVPFMIALVCIWFNEKFDLYKNKFICYPWLGILGISVLINCVLVLLVITMPASKEVALWQKCLGPMANQDKPVLLVLDQDGSYSDPAELNMDFYNPDQLIIDSVKDESHIIEKSQQYSGKKILYASRKRDRSEQLNQAGIQHELVCRALPEWILKININNWTSRTSMWRIWSIKP